LAEQIARSEAFHEQIMQLFKTQQVMTVGEAIEGLGVGGTKREKHRAYNAPHRAQGAGSAQPDPDRRALHALEGAVK
jgi:hypothetical protein